MPLCKFDKPTPDHSPGQVRLFNDLDAYFCSTFLSTALSLFFTLVAPCLHLSFIPPSMLRPQ